MCTKALAAAWRRHTQLRWRQLCPRLGSGGSTCFCIFFLISLQEAADANRVCTRDSLGPITRLTHPFSALATPVIQLLRSIAGNLPESRALA